MTSFLRSYYCVLKFAKSTRKRKVKVKEDGKTTQGLMEC